MAFNKRGRLTHDHIDKQRNFEANNGSLAWCLYGDIWGFGALTRANPEDTATRLASLQKECHRHIRRFPNGKLVFVSDSIFLFSVISSTQTRRDKLKPFDELRLLTKYLVKRFWEHDLPLRGAVTLGHVAFSGNAFVGRPVLEAVHLEQESLNAPIVVIPFSTLVCAVHKYHVLPESMMKDEARFLLDIPTKDGILTVLPLLGNCISDVWEHVRSRYYEATRGSAVSPRAALQLGNALTILKQIREAGDGTDPR